MTNSSLMSTAESEGRARQWVRDIEDAHKNFNRALLTVLNMGGARKTSFAKYLHATARKHLGPALIQGSSYEGHVEFTYLKLAEKRQLMPTILKVSSSGQRIESSMNLRLSLHFIARFLQYFRVREQNPMNSEIMRTMLLNIRQLDGSAVGDELIFHGSAGLIAQLCFVNEQQENGGNLVVLTTLITKDSLYPNRLRKVESARKKLVQKRQRNTDS